MTPPGTPGPGGGNPPIMLLQAPLFRRWAHLGLLLAAVLQLAGVAAGPWAHLSAQEAGPAHAAVLAAPADEAPAEQPPHNELDCFVCQALGAAGLPGADPSLPEYLVAAAAEALSAESARSLLRAALPQARAPPTA